MYLRELDVTALNGMITWTSYRAYNNHCWKKMQKDKRMHKCQTEGSLIINIVKPCELVTLHTILRGVLISTCCAVAHKKCV